MPSWNLSHLFNRKTTPRKAATKLRIDSLEERAVPAAPVIDAIADRNLLSNQSILQVPVTATDADGDALTYKVRVAGTEAYFVSTDLGLKGSDRTRGWGGADERWFKGDDGWYFLTPNGELSEWDGTPKAASGTPVASLPPLFHHYPDLLTRPTDDHLAYLIDHRLQLRATATPIMDSLGLGEKWFVGKGGHKFYLTPDGGFHRATNGDPLGSTGTLLAQLDVVYYANPKLLRMAQPHPVKASMLGSAVQLENLGGIAGSLAIQVKARDGDSAAVRSFAVHAVNPNAPVIDPVEPQILAVGENALGVGVSATDPNGDVLTYSVRAAGSEAYFLATDLGLKQGGRKNNWGKAGERWFEGTNGWYFIKPSGDLYEWDGTLKSATGELLATLPPLYHAYPDLLTKPGNQDLAYIVDQRLGLSPAALPAPNTLGLGEQWFSSGKRKVNFFITPEGALYRSQGKKIEWMVDLGSGYAKFPARLYGASPDRFSADIDPATGDLAVQTKPNFVGEFAVQVSVSDGVNVSTQIIPVKQSDYVSLEAPRVVGALATGNRTVLVSFSQPMNNAATNPANYSIHTVEGNVGATILSARFLGGDRTAVELTTLSLNETPYVVAAVNVKDLGGTALATPVLVNGVLVDPTRATFVGKAPTAADLTDTDGDGLMDHEEQRGWQVQVKLINGATAVRNVTSDPTNEDSDGDGLLDAQESNLRFDPRDADSDDDQLNDFQEFNEVFSDGTKQDSDGDGLDDSLEFLFFRSSPVDEDTDGDQLLDGVEILLGNRNARIADVPKPAIEVGAVNLGLDVRFTATSAQGTRELETKSSSSTLTQSNNKSFSREDANSHEFATSASVETGWEAGTTGFGAEGSVTVEAGYTGSWTSSFTTESSQETQNEVAKTYSTDQEVTNEETVQREVVGATLKVSVSLQSLANISFRIKNLQITAFMQDPAQAGKLVPVATLLPDTGVPNEFTLGPLVPERGPFVFTNDQIFPSLVERLMVNPAGLVFKIANYDIVDERDREFAFSSQEINDRTAPLVLDFGFGTAQNAGLGGGTTERYRVATSGGRLAVDTDGDGDVDGDDRPVVYDPATGKAVGITISDAMESIVGLTKYDEDETPSASLSQLQLLTSYSTKEVDGVERLWRIRGISKESNPLKNWVIFTPEGIDGSTDFSDLVLRTEGGLTFKFMQDLDGDGIEAAQEYMLGSSDTKLDTDEDGLTDAFEFFGRMPDPANPLQTLYWTVDVAGEDSLREFSSPARADSDLDGVSDSDEFNRFVDIDTDNDGTPDLLGVRRSTNPRKADSDADGVSDFEEINGYEIKLRFPQNGQTVVTRTSDPLSRDTDGDTLKDGDEKTLGTDPTVDDADKVLDDDADGLVNFQEDDGWDVVFNGVSTVAGSEGSPTTITVTTFKNDPDSDDDGLTDKEEFQLKTNPKAADTDGDGVNDIDELTITPNPNGTRTLALLYDPLDADLDDDKRSDGAELDTPIQVSVVGETPYLVSSDPKVADADLDGLVDGDEAVAGTDPTKFDTDGDNPGIGDARELHPDLGTNPLRKDQKVRVTITQVQLVGWDGTDTTAFDGTAEIHGTIRVGRPGALQDVHSFSGTEFSQNGTVNINASSDFILTDGETIRVQNFNFSEDDPGAGTDQDDLFNDAQKDFTFQVTAASDSISSQGQSGGGADGGMSEASIVTNFTLSIVS